MSDLNDEVFVKPVKKLRGLNAIRIDFSKVGDVTLKEVYGNSVISASDLAKFMWAFVKRNNLVEKKEG